MNISRLTFLILSCFSLVLASPIDPEIIDYKPDETFIEVFLKVYDMYLLIPGHGDRVQYTLSQFESDPFLLINDEICFPILLEHIYMGFKDEPDPTFHYRSNRLLYRILMARPGKDVLYKILEGAGPIERIEIIEMMIRTESIPSILDLLNKRSISSQSFENILMNKLKS